MWFGFRINFMSGETFIQNWILKFYFILYTCHQTIVHISELWTPVNHKFTRSFFCHDFIIIWFAVATIAAVTISFFCFLFVSFFSSYSSFNVSVGRFHPFSFNCQNRLQAWIFFFSHFFDCFRFSLQLTTKKRTIDFSRVKFHIWTKLEKTTTTELLMYVMRLPCWHDKNQFHSGTAWFEILKFCSVLCDLEWKKNKMAIVFFFGGRQAWKDERFKVKWCQCWFFSRTQIRHYDPYRL